MPGFVPHVTCGLSARDVDDDLAVERRVRVGAERAPRVERLLPGRARRRARTALEVGERRVVGRDHPGARAGLDRHVADRHPALHRERLDRRARVLDHVARRRPRRRSAPIAPSTMSFAVTPERQLAGERDAHRLRPRLQQRLRREHVLDLGRADAERERAERAVRRGVAVAADDRHPRLRQPELRARSRGRSPRGRCRSRSSGTPNSSQFAASASSCAFASGSRIGPRRRRDVVIHRRDRQVGPPHAPAGQRAAPRTPAGSSPRARGGGRRRAAPARRPLVDDVRVPDLLEERARSLLRSAGVAAEDPHLARPLAHLGERRADVVVERGGRRAPCRSGSGTSSAGSAARRAARGSGRAARTARARGRASPADGR